MYNSMLIALKPICVYSMVYLWWKFQWILRHSKFQPHLRMVHSALLCVKINHSLIWNVCCLWREAMMIWFSFISAFASWSSEWVSFISAFASWSSKWCSSTVSCNACNWNVFKCVSKWLISTRFYFIIIVFRHADAEVQPVLLIEQITQVLHSLNECPWQRVPWKRRA